MENKGLWAGLAITALVAIVSLALVANKSANVSVSVNGGEPVSEKTYGGTTNLDSLALDSMTLGSGGTASDKLVSATASLDFASIPASYCTDTTMTVTGAALGDSVHLGLSSGVISSSTSSGSQPGIIWGAGVSAADTVSVWGCNVSSTAATADLTADTFRATIMSF